MHSYTKWKHADKPNYSTNIDLVYPYSEIPHQGHHYYLKIPVSPNAMVKHVDYWGEGRVESEHGIRGFPNSYNVNHQYRLVSIGPDKDRKIPNRIPLVSYTDCDTSAFIKDNSVLIVTIPEARINSNCARDITRMVNDERGMVIAYSRLSDPKNISELTAELKTKGLLLFKDPELGNELKGLTYFDEHLVFKPSGKKEKDINKLKEDLFNYVTNGNYDAAVSISRSIGEAISETVTELIRSSPNKVLPYTYKLWHAGGEDIVRKHFPEPFQFIINKDNVKIINKQFKHCMRRFEIKAGQPEDRVGISKHILPSTHWEISPTYDRGELTFMFCTIHTTKYMNIVDDKDKGDSYCWASRVRDKILTDNSYKFLLDPSIGEEGEVEFTIICARNKHTLKVDEEETDTGASSGPMGRRARGHNGKIDKVTNILKWWIQKHPDKRPFTLLLGGTFDDLLDSD